jgi:hypothetical protein
MSVVNTSFSGLRIVVWPGNAGVSISRSVVYVFPAHAAPGELKFRATRAARRTRTPYAAPARRAAHAAPAPDTL